jgi:hypothetical protein
MEPEDYNGAVLTYVGHTDNPHMHLTAGAGISTTLSWNPPPLIDTIRYNSDASLQIPIAFEKVLKKSINGLSNIRVVGYETISIVNPMKWETESQFLTHIELTFKYESSLKLPKEDYTEKINFAFKMAYPDMETIKFSIKNIIVENKDFHREFLEFFSR